MYLQTQTPQTTEDLSSAHAALTERCLAEVLVCQQSTAAKSYIAALLKTAAGLNLENVSTVDAGRLKCLAGGSNPRALLLFHFHAPIKLCEEPALHSHWGVFSS